MVKNKKMSKTSIAVIVLALLLVFSLVMGMTGAWFTDVKSGNSSAINFGTLQLDDLSGMNGIAVSNTIETSNHNLMPGSTIAGTVTVANDGNAAAWLRYKIEFTGAGAEYLKDGSGNALSSDYVYVATALAGGASTTVAINAQVPTAVGNAAQGKAVNITLTVEALQQANTAAENGASVWTGVTVVAVE